MKRHSVVVFLALLRLHHKGMTKTPLYELAIY